MHEGVVRDVEQQRLKKERQLDFDTQRALEAEYRREQSVRDTTVPADKGGLRGEVAGRSGAERSAQGTHAGNWP